MICQLSANFIACYLATGEKCWYTLGCYLETGDRVTIWDVEAEMAERPIETEMIVAGDLNVDLERMGGRGWDKEITVVVVMARLEEISAHFLP